MHVFFLQFVFNMHDLFSFLKDSVWDAFILGILS